MLLNCIICAAEYNRAPAFVRRGSKYCSASCKSRGNAAKANITKHRKALAKLPRVIQPKSYRLVALHTGALTKVDLEDFEFAQERLLYENHGYARRGVRVGEKSCSLHRLILERKLGRPLKPGLFTDHINRHRLDNRRSNLREVTRRENNLNTSRGRRTYKP